MTDRTDRTDRSRRSRRGQPTDTGPYTLPDAPPPAAETDAEAGTGQRRDPSGDLSAPPMAGSEATTTVARGTARDTSVAGARDGDAVDGSEGSATGSRTEP